MTLGTIRPYKQDSLIEALLHSGLDLSDTVWQLGSSFRTDLPGEVHRALDSEEMDKNILAADVVITHAASAASCGYWSWAGIRWWFRVVAHEESTSMTIRPRLQTWCGAWTLPKLLKHRISLSTTFGEQWKRK